PVLHPGGALFVGASRDLADPIGRVASHLGDFRRRVPAPQQPEHVPAATGDGIMSLSIVLFQFADRQVRLEMNASCHAPFYYIGILDRITAFHWKELVSW